MARAQLPHPRPSTQNPIANRPNFARLFLLKGGKPSAHYSQPVSIRRSFFSAKPTFFREATFFFGRWGCELGAPAPHRVSAKKMAVELASRQFFSTHTIGRSSHIPAARFFYSFHATKVT